MRGVGLDQSPSSLASSTQRVFPPPLPPPLKPPWSNLSSDGQSGRLSGRELPDETDEAQWASSPAPAGVAPVVEEGRLPSVVSKVAIGILGRVPTASICRRGKKTKETDGKTILGSTRLQYLAQP